MDNKQDAQYDSEYESESEFEDDASESEDDDDSDLDDLENNDELIRLRREGTTLAREIDNLNIEIERRGRANASLKLRKDELIRQNEDLNKELLKRGIKLLPNMIQVDPIRINTTRISDRILYYNTLLSRHPAPPPQSGETPNPDIVETREIIQENMGMLRGILQLITYLDNYSNERRQLEADIRTYQRQNDRMRQMLNSGYQNHMGKKLRF